MRAAAPKKKVSAKKSQPGLNLSEGPNTFRLPTDMLSPLHAFVYIIGVALSPLYMMADDDAAVLGKRKADGSSWFSSDQS